MGLLALAYSETSRIRRTTGERAARDAAEQEAAAKKGTTTGGQKPEKNALEPDGAEAHAVERDGVDEVLAALLNLG